MLTLRTFIFLLFLFVFSSLKAQTAVTPAPKILTAKRFTGTIQIDGSLADSAWRGAPAVSGFTELRPTPFKPEVPGNRTEVWMLYNDEGIYMSGYCYEPSKDSVATELAGRDGFGNNDFIGFVFDTYKDKLNGFEYFITPLGEQWDAKVAPNPNGNSEDFSWNAVWRSAAQIHADGWSFEIFVPFSAIRFSKKNIQDWGLNIVRKRQKSGQQLFWNLIDPNVNGFLTQEGFWTGLENIKPPLRLQFTPYFSTYGNHYPQNGTGYKSWTSSVTGGMDVKYGISQALTLDMTLIPDFGQVQSDNQVLNLTPFEVKFNENRNFFTEGTELFNKGNLFYSRRIGSQPLHYYDVQGAAGPNSTIVKNPSTTRLINGTKVSGRLQGGLGVGFFNALVAPQYAVVEDAGKQQHRIQTNPLTNYNIIVLNQSLKHNSSISLVNTNVWRSGHDYDANVTAALFDFYDKKNTWNIGGKVGTSNLTGYIPGGKTKSGYTHSLYFGKVSGRFTFNIAQNLTDGNFDINDLGYITNTNFLDHNLYMGYNWTKPGKWYNNIYLNFNATYSRRLKSSAYQSANINMNVNGQLKNLWQAGIYGGFEPRPNDFYEPRVIGRVFKGWSNEYFGGWVQTNGAKKYSAYIEAFYVMRHLMDGKRLDLTFQHQYRFNNKFTLGHNLFVNPQPNNVGFAGIDSNNNIIFGLRNRSTVENVLSLKYNFSQKVWFTTRVRHYWSRADYKKFFLLLNDGELSSNTLYNENRNQNSNFFNVDALFTWQFGPGSFVNIGWKNAIEDFNRDITTGYGKNFRSILDLPQNNNFSLKVIYFLDYLQLKKHSHFKTAPKANNVM